MHNKHFYIHIKNRGEPRVVRAAVLLTTDQQVLGSNPITFLDGVRK